MSTPKEPLEDIIELTEVVEEGIALDLDDFSLDQPLGKGLEEELDALLAANKQAPNFASPEDPVLSPPDIFEDQDKELAAKKLADLDMNLDEILGDVDQDPTLDSSSTLEILLEGHESQSQSSPQSSLDHTEELDKNFKEPIAEDKVISLAEELLAATPGADHLSSESSTFVNDYSLTTAELWPESQAADPKPSKIEPELEAKGPEAPAVTLDFEDEDLAFEDLDYGHDQGADFELLLEEKAEEPDEAPMSLDQEMDLALESQGEELPLAAQALDTGVDPQALVHNLQEQIFSDLDARWAMLAKKEDFDNLTQMLAAVQNQVQVLEDKSEQGLSADQILQALPDSPDQMPWAQALRGEILNELESKLSLLPPTEVIEDLLQTVSSIQEQIVALENKPDPVLDLPPSQVLAALPSNPDQLPFMHNLRGEIFEELESKVQDLQQKIELTPDEMRHKLWTDLEQKLTEFIPQTEHDQLKQKVEDLVHSMELETEKSWAQFQEVQGEIKTWSQLFEQQATQLVALEKELEQKNKIILELQSQNSRLQEQVSTLVAPGDLEAQQSQLKQELQEYIQMQVPAAAAQIIREEMEALIQELSPEA